MMTLEIHANQSESSLHPESQALWRRRRRFFVEAALLGGREANARETHLGVHLQKLEKMDMKMRVILF